MANIGLNNLYLVVSVDFICNFELSWYPFDSQDCFMNLSLDSTMFVGLSAGHVVYRGRVDLAQYYVRNISLEEQEEGSVAARITLGRRVLSTLLTVYVPTLLLNIIALATNYFKVYKLPTINKFVFLGFFL